MFIRNAALDIRNDQDTDHKKSNTIVISCSSETPYERTFMWGEHRYIDSEILLHDANNVDLTRFNNKAPLLYQHNHDKPIGVIERAWIDEHKKLMAEVRFSNTDFAQDILRQVKDGTLNKTSIGYNKQDQSQVTEKEASEIRSTVTVSKWRAMEVSIVSVPADDSVGIETRALQIKSELDEQRIHELKNLQQTNQKKSINHEKEKITMTTKNEQENSIQSDEQNHQKSAAPEQGQITSPAMQTQTKSYLEMDGHAILEKGIELGESKLAAECVQQQRTYREFADAMMKKQMDVGQTAVRDGDNLNLSKQEIKSYSIARAVKAVFSNNDKLAPFEMELSRAAQEAYGRETEGFIVPQEILMRNFSHQTNTTNTDGLVQTEHQAGLIDQMKNNSAVLGKAQFLTGLQGNISFTRKTANTSAGWIIEGQDAPETSIATVPFEMTPKTLACTSNYSRKLITQSSESFESILRRDIEKEMILAMDYAALYGQGGIEPTGLMLHTIQAMTYTGGLNYQVVTKLRRMLKELNHDSNLIYLFDPETEETLETTPRGNGIQNNVLSALKKYEVSNQLKQDELLLGDFSELIVAQWGQGMEVLVNPYSKQKSLGIEMTASVLMDVGVRNETAFAIAKPE